MYFLTGMNNQHACNFWLSCNLIFAYLGNLTEIVPNLKLILVLWNWIKILMIDVKFWSISELIWQCFNISPLFSFLGILMEVLEKTSTRQRMMSEPRIILLNRWINFLVFWQEKTGYCFQNKLCKIADLIFSVRYTRVSLFISSFFK